MASGRASNTIRAARVSVLAILLTMAGSAFGAFGAHYLGFSRDRSEFRLYLDGGEFLGRSGSFQTIRVTVHQIRKGRAPRTLEGCVYHFDDTDRNRDRIECAQSTPGPLAGVEYARAPHDSAKNEEESEPLVCIRRCNPQVPQRLRLEDADEDNG